ncbi:MAG TPA: DUF3570 domain-containing protein [Kofleriaceae bacterium]|nr:DUF3570 domain-containing protein [Kofleriaceae bacterium]
MGTRGCTLAGLVAVAGLAAGVVAVRPARADDKVDVGTTWFQENRKGGKGGLTVIHPEVDLGVDAGDHVSISASYTADAVSGATAKVYSVDAVSSATTFSDLRHQGTLGLTFTGRRSTFGATATYGTERDYLSLTFSGDASIDLPGKNTTLGLSYSHGADQVCDRANAELTPFERRTLVGADPCKKSVFTGQDSYVMDRPELGTVTTWRDLTIDTAQATLNQNLTPTAVLQLSLYGQVLDGMQSNPYRAVRIGPNEPQEHVPSTRARGAVTARLNRFIPALHGAVHLQARGYSDTWGIEAGTFELGYSQYLGDSLVFRLRGHIHQQTAATFFKDAFYYETESAAGAYFTGDRELGAIRDVMVGGKLTMIDVAEDKNILGVFERLQLNLKADVLFLDELAADDPAGNPAGIGGQFLSSGQFLDAFTVQLGLDLDY